MQEVSPPPQASRELRRRVVYLMASRVLAITLVLGLTVVLNLASPQQLANPSGISLFIIIGATYLLTIAYAVALRHIDDLVRFADVQLAVDLLITSVLVHLTGGAQSGYTFFYALGIVSAATVRYRQGAIAAALASGALFLGVALLGWSHHLPVPHGQRVVPWELTPWDLGRQLILNLGALAATGVLAAGLGGQLSTQRAHTADVTALKDDIVRCLSSGLITVDRAGVVTTVNAAALALLGRERRDTLGHHVAEVFPEIVAHLGAPAAGGELRGVEIRAARGGVSRDLDVSITALTDGHDAVVGRVINFEDVTQVNRMRREVKEAERLATIGRVVAGVAHEIRNPLASISGSVELLHRGQSLAGDQAALMEIVLREIDRLNALVTDLLDYARPRERVPVAFDLGGLLEETVRVFAQDRLLDARLRHAGGPTARVLADPSQIRQVVWNLLRNAAEATPGAGEITTRVVIEGSLAALEVADAGGGIPAQDLERIFDPFFTTKPGGSGLGLPTVERIVNTHGGRIEVSSAVGEGSTFRVWLPLAPDED